MSDAKALNALAARVEQAEAPFAVGDTAAWHMREVAHYNGGKEWFGYGHQCIQQPRLYRLDKYTRKDRAVTSIWSVDGVDCADLTEAVQKLNAEPEVREDEITMLAALTLEFQPIREFRQSKAYLDLGGAASSILSHWLSRKGLVWAENGQVRRTKLGDRILAAALRAIAHEGGDDV